MHGKAKNVSNFKKLLFQVTELCDAKHFYLMHIQNSVKSFELLYLLQMYIKETRCYLQKLKLKN